MKSEKENNKTWMYDTGIKKLGNKQECYYKTEEEMLSEKKYTYESLSTSEKLIYNKLKQKR